jgi:hypothetical protein
MSDQSALPGMEAGRRTERVEWGLRSTADTVLHRKGEVDVRPGEENARYCVGRVECGHRSTEIVRRTIVTYTTPWERVEDGGDG